ncbi:MAG TPA: hypothetical protein PLD86_13040 [Vicinamibacteria bacterium]|nr:hypothetical protein [Vicinamibacteria bacterium]
MELTCADERAMGAGLSFRRGTPALAALFILALANASAAQMVTVKERAYWGVVTLYAKGERGIALANIGAWTESDLGRIQKSVEDLEKVARRCTGCEERRRFDALPLRAAILLHAERDRVDRAVRIQESGAADCAVSAHGRMSGELFGPAALQPGGGEFAKRFAVASSLHLRSVLCFLSGRNWAEAGLKLAPRDAMLHLADGLASESIGVTGFVEPNLRMARDARGRLSNSGYPDVKPRDELKRALGEFEKALASNPRLAEARLRAGRVGWRLGRGLEALESLKRAVSESEGALLYLAHLFLGQCLEDDGDLEGAIEHYAAAVALRPDTQIGAVALAHAHSRRGEPEKGREILGAALARSGTRRTVDPYWSYLMGATSLAETLLEELRVESVK